MHYRGRLASNGGLSARLATFRFGQRGITNGLGEVVAKNGCIAGNAVSEAVQADCSRKRVVPTSRESRVSIACLVMDHASTPP